MKNILKITLISAALVFFTSCETTELELLTSPNNITLDSADPNFVLNDIQLSFNGAVGGYNGPSRQLTRQVYQFGSYNGVVGTGTLSGEWGTSYQMFANIDILEGINENLAEEGGIPFHVGMAQVLEAYAYMLLVDFADAVPYSQANQPEEFPNPVLDSGASVYDAQLELLDAAIANLNLGNATNARVPEDIFYGANGDPFDASKWIALANTLKLRAYVNLRLTDPGRAAAGINSVASQNIIDTTAEDFQFSYSTTTEPNSLHPFFSSSYGASGSGQRMSNNFLDLLNAGDDQPPFIELGTIDPRTRYYIFRQDSAPPSGSNLPCAVGFQGDYCYVGNLYWGRDHADDEGLPADGFKRSGYGLYPGGGAFDKDEFIRMATTDNLGGAGIRPIYLASFTHFALAEAALTLGTSGNAASLLEEGIRISMAKVDDFASGVDTGGFEMTSGQVNDYVNTVMSDYNSANNAGKLAIIAREYFLAAWGNGMEPYNTYRRTGYPDLQSPIIAAGSFPRSYQYPETEVDGNPNISQRAVTSRVFWDNNPAGFID